MHTTASPMQRGGGGEVMAVEPRRSAITSIATSATRRWQITLGFMVILLIAGVSAYGFGLDREGFPPINTPIAIVTGTYFVDDADAVDAEVTVPLAEAFADVPDVIEVQTQARPSSFLVFVEFESSVDSSIGTERLAALNIKLPPGAQADYRSVNAAKFIDSYDLLVSVVGPADASPEQLQQQASALAVYLDGIGDISEAVVRDLLTDSIDPDTGEEETRLTRFTRVALGPGDFRDAIAVGVVRNDTSSLDVLGFTDLVQNRLNSADSPLADGFQAEITADFATGVRQQISSLTRNLLSGLLAVAAVSLLLIGWRVAVLTAGFMALVLMGALVGLWAVGYTLNTITLFGLILTLGLLVDDAIVISESIDANRDEPDSSEEIKSVGVVRRAIDRVGAASFAGTLTTVVVFSPMLFIGGILGEFIRPIPATVMITLLLSFLFSVVFIPVIGRLFLLKGQKPNNPIIRAEKSVAAAAGRLAAYPSGNGPKGWLVGLVLAFFAFFAIGSGLGFAGGLGFSIFPQGKDSVGLSLSAEFPAGTTIDEAQAISAQIDEVVVEVLGEDLLRAQYARGNERLVQAFIDLTAIGSRPTKSPEFVEQIEERLVGIEGARVTIGQLENGPPVEEFPFAMQISVDDDNVEAAQAFASELQTVLVGQEFPSGSETVTIVDARISTDGSIARTDGARYIEVRAKYDEDSGISGILTSTEELLAEDYPGDVLEARGLAPDALGFDFGLESDNQDDFAGLQYAGLIALALMLLLLTIQFRSLAQSMLIFLAIPFSFFGVFGALMLSDNPLSFLAVVGFIALIGVAVNNTILLVDAANQERRNGTGIGESIGSAVTSRFRPLVATTITTVAGLLPLSLADPFWESLGFTLMGGLVSSTVLVLLSFPAFYIALETVRTFVRNLVRGWLGKPLIGYTTAGSL
ncbi:MAG: efflux RND transporter permease subunit [Acidimicrobiales bacterium]|nr:efflux RND transporter permease subunit [Acidimicrobiales bacterium]